jgi:sec-independent protein translocase protein TatC
MPSEEKNPQSPVDAVNNETVPSTGDVPGPRNADGSTRDEPDLKPASDGTNYTVEDPYNYEDPYSSYGGDPYAAPPAETTVPAVPAAASTPVEPPPPKPPSTDEEDDDEEGMLRMSFLEHLEELRTRIIHALIGMAVAFLASLTFSERLWGIVQEPATAALKNLGYTDTTLVFTSPMESFTIIWMKLPLLTAVFLASPWILYQVWAFVAPGLYKRERRFAGPFIVTSAGLFIAGGLFAYFVAFRFGLTFLLGIGQGVGVRPMVTISEYFDIFVNVVLGIGIVFELPVLIFFLTLLRITTPGFLLRNSRYAVLGIVVLAAIITPTPDVFNLMIFSVPMVLLYFVGIFASYLLVLSREGRRFPWARLALLFLAILAVAGIAVWLAITRYGYELTGTWPYLVKP